MEKKISINNGSTAGSPLKEVLQNFVSVYSCPSAMQELTPVETFPIYDMNDTSSGKSFIENRNAKNSIMNKIKDIVTVSEFEILCNTTYRSPVEQIVKYHLIIGKLIEAGVFLNPEDIQ